MIRRDIPAKKKKVMQRHLRSPSCDTCTDNREIIIYIYSVSLYVIPTVLDLGDRTDVLTRAMLMSSSPILS